MPTNVGPNTYGEENLVFGYDLGDSANSYRGEPTTNEFLTTTIGDYSGYGGNGTLMPGTLDPFGTTDNPVYRKTGKLRFGPTGGQDVGTLYYGNTYTFSIYLRFATGEATWTGGEFDLYDRSDSRDFSGGLGDNMTYEWKRFSVTAYHNNNANYHFVDIGHYQGTNVFEWCCPQIDFGNHATPFTQTSRSVTQGLIDLTGNSTLNLTNVSFDSNAQMTFDGTTDYITVPHSSAHSFTGDFSIEIVFKPTGNTANCLIQKGSGNDYYQEYWVLCDTRGSNRTFELIMGKVGNTSANYNVYAANSATIGQYHHIVTGVQGNTGFMYVNGELIDTGDVTDRIQSTSDIRIGERVDGFADTLGDQPLTKIYNRALTASEIKANYNAIKGRFNI